MVAKVVGGIVGLGLISTGGIAMAKPHWLGMDYMPSWHSLSKDSDYESKKSTDYAETKFGGKYKKYLVGYSNKHERNNETSEAWWEWAFRKLQASKPTSTKFKYEGNEGTDAVKIAYSKEGNNADPKALNQICKAAYKAEASNITSDGTGEGNYKEEDVWKYCSPLGEKPKTVKDNGEDTSKYGTPDNAIGKENKDKLVSTKGNDLFWEIRDKEFKNEDNYGPIEAGTSSDAFFKKDGDTKIRDLCEKAYSLESETGSNSTAQKPTKDQTIKYCSLDKQ